MTEIHGIQDYLFAGGKLKDMVAASDLFDQLWSEKCLDQVLRAANAVPEEANIIRKAGGAFVAIYADEATAQRLKALWLLFVAHALPGAGCVAVVVSGDTLAQALHQGQRALQQQRNQPTPLLPRATPLTILNQRTGQSAETKDPYPPNGEEPERMDAAMRVKRRHFWNMQKKKGAFGLEKKFCDLSGLSEAHWPRDMETDFKAHGSDVALIHADGNGLGVCLHQLSDCGKQLDDTEHCRLRRAFSQILKDAGEAAAKEATLNLLTRHLCKNVMPARPLVLGGDDLTLVVRADLAMAFTKIFCETFEKYSKNKLSQLKHDFPKLSGLPEKLTLCAGVAFVKVNQPFTGAYQLAESLCDFAKKQGRDRSPNAMPSAVCFHRPGASLFDKYETILKRDLTVLIERKKLLLTASVYGLGEQAIFPSLETLLNLVERLTDKEQAALTASPLRALANRLYQTPGLAYQNYQRWWNNLAQTAGPSVSDALHAGLKTLLNDEPLKPAQFPEKDGWSPLGDLLTLCQVADKSIVAE